MAVQPLVVTGMHRSGTSATARLLHRAGLDLGAALMPPTLDNPLGYYEDARFLELNRALIAAAVGSDPHYQPDWAHPDKLVPSRLEPLRPRAAELIAERGAAGRAWGFKDPRATVLLDFYDELVPGARYLFVYRAPWQVVESLMFTRDRPLHGRADVAVRAWIAYNKRLLAFRERRPGRTVLVHMDAIAHRPDRVLALAAEQLAALAPAALNRAAAQSAFVAGLPRRTESWSPLAELLAADHPEAIELYERLEHAADLAGFAATGTIREPALEFEQSQGELPLCGIVLGGDRAALRTAQVVAHPEPGATPTEAVDAGIDRLPGDLVAVVFESEPSEEALTRAVGAMRRDSGLGAVLLAAGPPSPLSDHDPLSRSVAGAAIVLRREAWLATRGFAAVKAPAGFEASAFAAGCMAQGIRTARIDGALNGGHVARDEEAGRRLVLELYPALAVRTALRAEAERDAAASRLGELQATRAWRWVTRWWWLQALLRDTPRRAVPRGRPRDRER